MRSSIMLSIRIKRWPVGLVNCHIPAAFACEYAFGLNDDSTCGSRASCGGMFFSKST